MSTKTLKSYSESMDALKEFQSEERALIVSKAVGLMVKTLRESKQFERDLKRLESSKDLTCNDDEYFHRYVRIDLIEAEPYDLEMFHDVLGGELKLQNERVGA